MTLLNENKVLFASDASYTLIMFGRSNKTKHLNKKAVFLRHSDRKLPSSDLEPTYQI